MEDEAPRTVERPTRRVRPPVAPWTVFPALACVGAVAAGFVRGDRAAGATVVLTGVLAVAAMASAVLRERSRHMAPRSLGQVDPYLLVVLAMACLVAADGVRTLGGQWAAPMPALGDLLALPAYPLAIGGFLTMIRDRVPGRAVDSLLTAAIGAGSIGFVAWTVALATLSGAASVSPFRILLAVLFPVADVLVACTIARLGLLAQGRRPLHGALLLGWVCVFVVHLVRAVAMVSDNRPSPGGLALASMLALALWGGAGLHPDTGQLIEPVVTPPPRLTPWQVVLLAVAVALGPLVLTVAATRRSDLPVPLVLGGSMVLSLLVLVHLIRLVQARAAIEHRVHHDELTGLPNRTMFFERLSGAFAYARRSQGLAAVMFLDLDRFKNVNDSLGHAVGNQLLQAAARRLRQSVPPDATVARIGGDEFTVLLPRLASSEEAAAVAECVLAGFREPCTVGKRKLFVSPSIGVAVFPVDGDNPTVLLKNADTAMYRAKEEGRQTYRLYSPTMSARAHENLDLESRLHTAIDNGELVLHYQPKVDLRTGRMVGTEALIRWQHPELGLLAPGRFIPMAEDSGLIVPLGEWALQEACRQNKAWQTGGFPSITVAVNLSARQFQHECIEDMTARVLRATGLDPEYLEFELTESLALQDPERISATLCDLKEMGVRCSIDDFGTGYSGLSYLTRFPIDALKIDKSFVWAIGDDDSAPIVVAIVALAHSLNMEVVAEGVETQEQLDFLRKLGCDQMQGYLFSPALPADALERLLMLELVVPGPGRLGTAAAPVAARGDVVEPKPMQGLVARSS